MLMGVVLDSTGPRKIERVDNPSNKKCSSDRCIVYREYIMKEVTVIKIWLLK